MNLDGWVSEKYTPLRIKKALRSFSLAETVTKATVSILNLVCRADTFKGKESKNCLQHPVPFSTRKRRLKSLEMDDPRPLAEGEDCPIQVSPPFFYLFCLLQWEGLPAPLPSEEELAEGVFPDDFRSLGRALELDA